MRSYTDAFKAGLISDNWGDTFSMPQMPKAPTMPQFGGNQPQAGAGDFVTMAQKAVSTANNNRISDMINLTDPLAQQVQQATMSNNARITGLTANVQGAQTPSPAMLQANGQGVGGGLQMLGPAAQGNLQSKLKVNIAPNMNGGMK